MPLVKSGLNSTPLTRCETRNKFAKFSEFQFPHLLKGTITSIFRLVGRFRRAIVSKGMQKSPSVNVTSPSNPFPIHPLSYLRIHLIYILLPILAVQ